MQTCKHLLAAALLALAVTGQAQVNGLGLQPQVPTASITTNPALESQNNWHLWLPGLGGFSAAGGHTAFSLSDALDGNYLDIEGALSELDPTNHLWSETRIPVFQAGFRLQNMYFRLGASATSTSQLSYPGELLELAWKGNGHPDLIGRRLDFDGLAVNAMGYTDVYLGGTFSLMDSHLSVGGNLHLLSGIGVVYTENSSFGLTTAADDYTLTADGSFDVFVGGAAEIDSTDITFESAALGPGKGNTGMAIDLGAAYTFGDWTVDASVMNLGAINWERNGKHYSLNDAEFTFSGFDLEDFVDNPDSSEAVIENLVDSLTNTFDVMDEDASFTTRTPSKFQLTARYRAWEGGQVYLGFNSTTRFDQSYSAIHAGVAHQFGEVLTVQADAQWFNGDQLLLGAGLAVRGGPVLFFAQTSTLPALINPIKHRTWQGSMGIILAFGHPEQTSPVEAN